MKNKLIDRINAKESIIGIIGVGYVGLPLAREFLKKGFKVLGFDVDKNKVDKINRAETYIKHINHDFLKEFVLDKNKLSATSDFSELKKVDFILICVPTPLDAHYNPDLSYVKKTIKTITENLRKGHIIILESTTYPGTTEEEILPLLEESGMKVGEDFYLGYSPEREDPGNKDFSTGTIPKIISAITPEGLEIINALYSQFVSTVPVSSPKVAEAAKILENTYRAVNIALVNELKTIFYRMGIDVWEVIEAAKTKPFGFQAFYPGPGLGGHCIPIDPFYLTWKAKEYDIHTHFIELAGEINNLMPYYVVEKIIKALNSKEIPIFEARILIVGVSYKPDVDDVRESPALKIIEILKKESAKIDYYDPYIPCLPKTRKYDLNLKSIDIKQVENKKYHAAVIISNHSNLDYDLIIKKADLIIDTRNALKQNGIIKGNIWKA